MTTARSKDDDPVVVTLDVERSIGDRVVLSGVNITVSPGEVVGRPGGSPSSSQPPPPRRESGPPGDPELGCLDLEINRTGRIFAIGALLGEARFAWQGRGRG